MTKHFQPKDTAQLLEALQACSDKSLILAGGTDAVIGMRRKGALPDLILFPGGLPGIRDIEVTEDAVTIGAMATMRDTASKLAGIRELAALADACSGVGSAQIRNKATLAGNLCTGSPAGDMLPVAALYGMRLEVLDASGERSMVPFDRFLLGPRKTCLRPGQMVMKLII
ncbi:MAG: FAD binding domain-containing protein, partial [Clostridia bacterium]|nr:FAD binding domain-containing protein [Clostridia bacterium]